MLDLDDCIITVLMALPCLRCFMPCFDMVQIIDQWMVNLIMNFHLLTFFLKGFLTTSGALCEYKQNDEKYVNYSEQF